MSGTPLAEKLWQEKKKSFYCHLCACSKPKAHNPYPPRLGLALRHTRPCTCLVLAHMSPCQADHTWRKGGESEDRSWCRQAPRLDRKWRTAIALGPGVGWVVTGVWQRPKGSGCPIPAAHLTLCPPDSFLKAEEEPAAWEAEGDHDTEQRAGEDRAAMLPREQAQNLAGVQKPP